MRYAVLAFFDYQSGLAVAAGNTASALESRGEAVSRICVHPDGSAQAPEGDLADFDVALFHANPWSTFVSELVANVGWDRRKLSRFVNVCAPYYELDAVPSDWILPLTCMDAILAPTAFMAESLARDLPTARVLYSPQTVLLPARVEADRERFGIPAHVFAFVTSFDLESDVMRKNPWGAIEAFRRAFPNDSDVRLVVRAKQTSGAAAPMTLQRDLLAFVANDPRVILVQGSLDYREILSLYASTDAYISLHRAEGLGLGPMEAMALGLPVIATGWSGNMDFMNGSNSMPVAFKLVPLDVPEDSAYRNLVPDEHAYWADPDVDDAVRAMRAIRSDEGLRRRLGGQARMDIEARRRRFLKAEFADEIEELLRSEYLRGAEHRAHVRNLGRLLALHRRTSAHPSILRRLVKRVTRQIGRAPGE
jgi:glycosyltransferase involved in cell wall biosynthesis